jgi:hypothetical protein
MGVANALQALYPLQLHRRKLEFIRSDNGPTFIAAPYKAWLKRVGIEPIQILSGIALQIRNGLTIGLRG